MPKTTDTHKRNREAIVLNAMLTCPSVYKVSQQTGIGVTDIYAMLKRDSFQEQLQEARARATDETIEYLKANLYECSEALMEIVRNKENSPQVRINAINSVFNNAKLLSVDTEKTFTGLAVKIIDSI